MRRLQSGTDPLAAIRAVNSLATPDGTTLLVLQNFHRFLQSPEIIQAVAQQISAGKQNRTILIVLAPIVQLPEELEKLFVVLAHDLPSREQLAEIAGGIATEEDELPDDAELQTVLDAAAGLTRLEAENAFSLSLVRHSSLQPQTIWELKSQMLKKSGLMSRQRGSERFAGLGGLTSLKAFCLRAMRRQGDADPLKRPRGVMLLSPPGCGSGAGLGAPCWCGARCRKLGRCWTPLVTGYVPIPGVSLLVCQIAKGLLSQSVM